MFGKRKTEMVDAAEALPGRQDTMPVPGEHFVNGHPLVGPWPVGYQTAATSKPPDDCGAPMTRTP